jgi:hypothetical protein
MIGFFVGSSKYSQELSIMNRGGIMARRGGIKARRGVFRATREKFVPVVDGQDLGLRLKM